MHRDPFTAGLSAVFSLAGVLVMLVSLALEHRPYRAVLLLLICVTALLAIT